jgi:hypothetical protein
MNKLAALLTATFLLFLPSCGEGAEEGPGGDNGGVVNENGGEGGEDGEGGEGEGDDGDGY